MHVKKHARVEMQSSNLSCFLLNFPNSSGVRASAAAITTQHLRTLLVHGIQDMWTVFYYRFHQKDDVALQLKAWIGQLREQIQDIGGIAALGKFIENTDLALRIEGLMPLQAYWKAFLKVLEGCARARVGKIKKLSADERDEAIKSGREHETPSAYMSAWTSEALFNLNEGKYCAYWSLLQKALEESPFGDKSARINWTDTARTKPFFFPVAKCSVSGRWDGFLAWVEKNALSQYAEWVMCILAELRDRSALSRKSRGESETSLEESAQWLRGISIQSSGTDEETFEPFRPPLLGLPFSSQDSVPKKLLECVCPDSNIALPDDWRFLVFCARYGYARSTLDAKSDVDRDWGHDEPPRWLLAARAYIMDTDKRSEKKCVVASEPASLTSPAASTGKQNFLASKKRKLMLSEWANTHKSRPGTSRISSHE